MSKEIISRKEAIRRIGLALGALSVNALPINLSAITPAEKPNPNEPTDNRFSAEKLDTPVRAIVIGAGSRGKAYGSYATAYAHNLKIVGVAEPIPIRRDQYGDLHDIDTRHRFETWEEVFRLPKFAEAVILTTPDELHYAPCIEALKKGYHVLIEKPIAPSEAQCRDILAQSRQSDRIVAVCHVLRYSPYFRAMKETLTAGKIGELLSIQHLEPIEVSHFTHSFVRGNWRNERIATPLILSKSCHDLDILRWLVDQPCRYVSAFGAQSFFKPEKAPAGAAARCTDCSIEKDCSFSAVNTYYRKRSYLWHFDFKPDEDRAEAIMRHIETGPYGRCVFACDNDQPDHYTMNMLFGKDITASFNMEACTAYAGRRTRLMGSEGNLEGDEKTLTLTDFKTRTITQIPFEANRSGHGGGDWGLAHDFAMAVGHNDPSRLSSTIDASIESHVMGFAAEKSRKQKTTEIIRI